jgi:hypothetical protein
MDTNTRLKAWSLFLLATSAHPIVESAELPVKPSGRQAMLLPALCSANPNSLLAHEATLAAGAQGKFCDIP